MSSLISCDESEGSASWQGFVRGDQANGLDEDLFWDGLGKRMGAGEWMV